MTRNQENLTDSATDVTITYQSSFSDESIADNSASESYKDRILDIEREGVRLVDLPKRLIDVGEVIGKGGMGVVRLAQQSLPKREVGVKRLHFAKARLAKALLDEAMIMGGLEHPNIVPVHLVCLSEDNSPEVVMKYVQGKPWNEVLDKSAQRGNDLFAAIDVMRAVCRAVEFAHSRGVIHRDIKPHNVMVGRFGEVYLMDWGIAVRTTNIDQVPDGLVGTPGYIAPEMLSGIASDVTFQTDVFLLGATLHAVLTGERRHKANNVVAALDAAGRSEPYTYGPDVPPVLAEIANRACAKDPLKRYSTASTFRDELEKYLALREAYLVFDNAVEKAKQLERLVVKPKRNMPPGPSIRQYFAEARFGLEQALQMAPELNEAESLLQKTQQIMIRWLLSQSHIDEATHLLETLPKPDMELANEVSIHRAETRRNLDEIEYLKKVAPQFDPSRSRLGQRVFGAAVIIIVMAMVIAVIVHDTLYPSIISPTRLLVTTGSVAFIVCAAALFSRRLLFRTNLGSRLTHTVVLGFCAAPLLAVASIKAGYPADAIMVADTLFIALAMAASYPVIRSGRMCAVFAVINVGIAALYPEWAHTGLMLSAAVSAPCFVYDWSIRLKPRSP